MNVMEDLPFEIVIDKKRNDEAADWCRQQWGDRWSVVDNRKGIWCCFWCGTRGVKAGMYRYHFQNERDAIMFALRWS